MDDAYIDCTWTVYRNTFSNTHSTSIGEARQHGGGRTLDRDNRRLTKIFIPLDFFAAYKCLATV
jgi:hypothetical protein